MASSHQKSNPCRLSAGSQREQTHCRYYGHVVSRLQYSSKSPHMQCPFFASAVWSGTGTLRAEFLTVIVALDESL
eukprot:5772530-Amphidinium_carterae.1